MSSDVEFTVVIPARYASTRLPGKPLRLLHGKPMIEWVCSAARQSGARQVVVATDDQRIADAVEAFGGDVQMTSAQHRTGTDRIVEVCSARGWSEDRVIVNLQGDEPLMAPQNLAQVAHNLVQSDCAMATLHKSISALNADQPNQVKLVHDRAGRALYFSRSRIPYHRDPREVEPDYLGHIGLYAYRVGFLKTFAALEPTANEQAEMLEQLRALEHGFAIHTELAIQAPGPGVDTEDDLLHAEAVIMERAG